MTAKLAACGNCTQRAQLQQELDHWRRTDRLVNEAEHAALAAMGLGEYRNIGELQIGLLEKMAIASQQIEAQRQRDRDVAEISRMVHRECRALSSANDDPACAHRLRRGEAQRRYNRDMQACLKDNDPLRIYANDQMVRQICSKLEQPAACIAENSLLAKAQRDNQTATRAEMQARADARQQRKAEEQRSQEAAQRKREDAREERRHIMSLPAHERAVVIRERQAQQRETLKDRAEQHRTARDRERECETG